MDNNYTDSLQHYGILGMKWGIRRFQNDDGSLTAEGRKRYEHSTDEVMAEKQKAYETGKAATVTGYAAQKAQKRADRANARLEKAEESGNARKVEKAKAKADLHNKVAEQLWKDYEDYAKKGEEHVAKLISEYGEENVKGLRYRENKLKSGKGPDKPISERTFNAKDVAVAAGKTFVTNTAFRLMGLPMAIIYTPPSGRTQGTAIANERLRQAKREQKRQETTPPQQDRD